MGSTGPIDIPLTASAKEVGDPAAVLPAAFDSPITEKIRPSTLRSIINFSVLYSLSVTHFKFTVDALLVLPN